LTKILKLLVGYPGRLGEGAELDVERRSECQESRPCETSESWTYRRTVEMAKLFASPDAQVNKVEDGIARYEEAFHNFVSSHDNYLLYEEDEERSIDD